MSLAHLDGTAASDWLCTFAMHSTLVLGLAWLVGLALQDRAQRFQEGLLRLSLWAALLSSSVQCFVVASPLSLGRLSLAADEFGPLPLIAVAEAPFANDPLAVAPTMVSSSFGPLVATLNELPWTTIVVVTAGLAAAFGLVWLWFVYRGLARVLAIRQPEVDPRVLATAAQVAQDLGLRQSPHVSRCDLIATPIAFGWLRPEICLPARVSGLGNASLRAMLAHEIAHLRRNDPAWMWLAAVLQAMFPWQVLLWGVRRRWARLVELRCDAIAAQHSSPTDVARCLIDVAEWLRPGVATPLGALGMAARPSALRERVEAALHLQPAAPARPLAFAAFSGLSLGALTLVAPGVQSDAGPFPAAFALELPDARFPALDMAALPGFAAGLEPVPDSAPAPADGPNEPVEAMQLLHAEQAGLLAEAARLRADLRGRAQSPLIAPMLSALERRLSSLERLRARLQARLDRRSTENR